MVMSSGSGVPASCSPPPRGIASTRLRSREVEGRVSLTRRRTIRIVAAAAGLPLVLAAVRATAPSGQLFRWQGDVLGALSELTLWHTDAALARRTILRIRGEIARYEGMFSLYRQDSEISRLNAAGTLHKPSPELRSLVDDSRRLGVLSDGAFDISVQPLWRRYAAPFLWRRDGRPLLVALAPAG